MRINTQDRTAKAVQCGAEYTCAVLDNNRVKCWGGSNILSPIDNEILGAGFLGYGDGKDRGTSAADMGDNLPYVDLGTVHSMLPVLFTLTIGMCSSSLLINT